MNTPIDQAAALSDAKFQLLLRESAAHKARERLVGLEVELKVQALRVTDAEREVEEARDVVAAIEAEVARG